MKLNSQSLIRWASLEEKRRKSSIEGIQGLSGLLLAVLLGGALAAEVGRRLLMASSETLVSASQGASRLWFTIALCAYVIGVFGAPFRLFWRRDSKILSSLPVPGKSLYALALWRSHRSAMLISMALILALLPLGLWGSWSYALRHGLIVCMGALGIAWLGPAAALSAGSIVASDKAQAMIASMSGDFQAPKNSWLSILPGLAATFVALAILGSAEWIDGGRIPGGSIGVFVGVTIIMPLVMLLWSWTKAEQVIPAAVREVAALDQEILAHVERSEPSWLERKASTLVNKSMASQALFRKDASLMRRRYPSPYFVIPCGIVAIWIVALSQPLQYLPWGGSIYGSMIVYAFILAKRLGSPPIEIPRMLHSLALSPSQIIASKNTLALLRIFMIVILAGIPLILRAPNVLNTFILVVIISISGIVSSAAIRIS